MDLEPSVVRPGRSVPLPSRSHGPTLRVRPPASQVVAPSELSQPDDRRSENAGGSLGGPWPHHSDLLMREHRIALPDDAELLEELATVRLRESTPGVYRLDHDASGHDDRAVALGLAALALTERAEGRGSITVPGSGRAAGRIDERTNVDARPSLPKSAAVRAAAEADAERTAGRRGAAARLSKRPAAGAQHPRQLAPRQLAARLLTPLW